MAQNNRELFFYFFKLSEATIGGLHQNWPGIANHDFDSKSLANILHKTAKTVKGLPKGRTKQDTLDYLKANIGFWESRATQELPKFNSQNLSNTLWAYATLGIKPGPKFMAAFEAQAIQKLPKFNSQDLSNTLWAYATLGIKPGPKFMATFEAQTTQQLPKFNSQELANTLWAYATLGIKPGPEFMATFEAQATQQLPKFNSQELANTLWASAVMSCIQSDDNYNTRPLAEMLYECVITKKDLLIKGKTQALLAARLFGFAAPGFMLPETDQNGSTLEINLWRALSAAGAVKCPDIYHSKTDIRVDFCLRTGVQSNRQILFEADGHWHFVTDPNGKIAGWNGGTLLMTTLIQMDHPEIPLVRVPAITFEAVQKRPDAADQWRAFLGGLETLAPGAYVALSGKIGIHLSPMPIPLKSRAATPRGYYRSQTPAASAGRAPRPPM